MNVEIRFLDQNGGLSCLMNESFFSLEQAERYARSVLKGPMGASVTRVELNSIGVSMGPAHSFEAEACAGALGLPDRAPSRM
ncbi:MAG: hypothetical protein ACREFW_06700 [Rhizomicrobium sp.]